MADPVVHITNGIPDLGTGNITTLGMTLSDGANGTLGSTVDVAVAAGAAGTINAHLRSISRDLVGGIVLQPSGNVIGTVNQGGSNWSTNVTQFGGAAVVTGTGISGAGVPRVTVSSDTVFSVNQGGTWNIGNITGTVPLPTGASTAAKQPALGTAGIPSADVLSVQGISGGTALAVNGSGGTFPVTGTVTANQGGAWNITNISGTISLPTGAASAAKQPALGTAGTPSTDVITIQGAPAMTALKTNINGSSGAVMDFPGQNATAPANALLIGGEFNTAPTTISTGNASPLQLDNSGNLKVNIQAGAGSGGTASTFGAAFPGQGTAAGATDGTNMRPLQVDGSGNLKVNIQAGAGSGGTASPDEGAITFGTTQGTPAMGVFQTTPTNNALTTGQLGIQQMTANRASHVNIRAAGGLEVGLVSNPFYVALTNGTTVPAIKAASTAAVAADPALVVAVSPNNTIPVSGTFWQTTQPVSGSVTVTQGTAANLNATVTGTVGISGSVAVTGTFWQATQPISGTVNAAQSGTWTVQPGNTANTTAWLVTGTGGSFPATQSGTWSTRCLGNAGGVFDFSSAQNQSTPGQAILTGGEYNSAPVVITSGNSSPLQLNSAGSLRVDGSAVVQPVSGTVAISGTVPVSGTVTANQGGSWTSTVTQATASSLNATVVGTGTFAVQAAQSGTWNINAAASQSGTWTVQRIQSAANTNLTQTRVVAAATTNATSLKASAGNIAAIDLFNVASYMVFLKLYNKASAPTVGTDTPVWTIPIPASGGFSIDFSQGEYFSTGIAFAITKLQADGDTTALVAGDVTGRIKWV